MKVLITGANGQLGTELCRILGDVEIVPLTHRDIEITDIDAVRQIFRRHKPEVIVNTAAYVRVDDCETEVDRAFRVNALGVRNVAVAAQEVRSKLIHVSSDYVFGGESEVRATPFTEFDRPFPANVYGMSKLAGESFVLHLCHRHFIIRTSGLFGVAGSSGKGGNLVETMIRLGKERREITVVNDQVFSPTCALDLAEKIAQLMRTEYYGTFHITNKGTCSWFEFTREILSQAGMETTITPITSDQYPQQARRPRFSVLDNYHLRLLGMDDMRPWQDALRDYLKEKGHLAAC